MDLVKIILKEKRRVEGVLSTMQPGAREIYLQAYKDCMKYNQRLEAYQRQERKERNKI